MVDRILQTIEEVRQITELIRPFEHPSGLLASQSRHFVIGLQDKVQKLYSLSLTCGGYVEPEIDMHGILSEESKQTSLIKEFSVEDGDVRIIIPPLPHKKSKNCSQFGAMLRGSLLSLPEHVKRTALSFPQACLVIDRQWTPACMASSYDADNACYAAIINALQGILLKSERAEYLRQIIMCSSEAVEPQTIITVKKIEVNTLI